MVDHPDMRPKDTPSEPEHTFSSTTFAWKYVKITGPSAPKTQRAAGAPPAPLLARDPRKPITIQLEYRGGPEAKWRVRARGRNWHFPCSMALHDVMAHINATLQRPER